MDAAVVTVLSAASLLTLCSYFSWQVYELYPSLLAEQTAYATACATLGLKHYRINNYAVESEKASQLVSSQVVR